jgi:hypothetical protein
MTSSCHRCLGLPTGLVPNGFQANSFLVGLAWSIRCIRSSHLILCALLNLTISAPSINLYPTNVENWASSLQYSNTRTSNKMQRYTVYLYLETALHVSGGISTHHHESIQLYLQHLVWRTPPTAHSNRFQLFHDSDR